MAHSHSIRAAAPAAFLTSVSVARRRFLAGWPWCPIAISALLAVGGAGCSAGGGKAGHEVAQPGDVAAAPQAELLPVESGFLSDYSQLKPSDQFAALLMYRDDSRKGGYRKLLFRPVEVWRGADRRLEDVPEEDLQYLADALYDAVAERLGKSFEMVTKPGPGVLEIHMAFTLVTTPESSIDFFSTAVPVRDLAPRQGELAEGTCRFVRDSALELELLDVPAAAPGTRRARNPVRAAFFDLRRGTQTPKGTVESWQDVNAVFDKWAGVLDERLVALRDGSFRPRLTIGDAKEKRLAR